MKEKEIESLRTLYQQWSTEQLVRATTVEKNDYQQEAIPIILEELKQRGFQEEDIKTPPAEQVPCKRTERNTLLLPARLSRKEYAIRTAPWFAIVILFGLTTLPINAIQPVAFIIWILGGMIYKVIGLDIPRLKNAGIPPVALLLFFVPIANLFIQGILFAAPTKNGTKTEPTALGKENSSGDHEEETRRAVSISSTTS